MKKVKLTVNISKCNYERIMKLGITNISFFIDNVLTDYLDFLEENLSKMRDDEREDFKKLFKCPYIAVFLLLNR